MRCSSTRECSGGQTCINGLCCTTTGDEWRNACAGLTAISSCTNGTCGAFVCTTSNYCCECEFGRTSGLCSSTRVIFHHSE
uniref:CC domain-containing protein n=1 Tax=Angiostrongylus cantonensis TaxID=6313 RepID=A0A0K0DQP7_ANGCA